MRGFHSENQCMKKTIDQLTTLLEHNNISLPQSVDMYKSGEETEEYERFHALKEGFTQSKSYLIDSGAYTTWFPPKNPSLLWISEEDLALIWGITHISQL